MVCNLVADGLDDWFRFSGPLVVFNNGLARFLSRLDNLQGREAFDAKLTTKGFVGVFIAIDRSYLSQPGQTLSSLLVCRFQVLAVSAPGCVELDNLGHCQHNIRDVVSRGMTD